MSDPRIEGNVRKMIELGAPEADIDSYLKTEGLTAQQFRSSVIEPKETGHKAGATDMLAQGATLGFSDEVGAAGRAVGGSLVNMARGEPANLGGEYDSAAAAIRAELEGYKKESPAAAIAAELTGALASGGPIGSKVVNAASRVPAWLRGAATGAGFGGVAGAGYAEGGIENRAIGAGMGATLGGVVGGAVPIAADMFSSAGNRAVQNAVGMQPTTQGQRKVLEAFGRDQVDPTRVQARLRTLGPQATIADAAGENTLGLARGAAAVPGPSKNRAAAILEPRQTAQGERLYGAVNRGLKPDLYYEAEDKFISRLRTNADSAYKKAYAAKDIESQKLDRLLERPIIKDAIDRAADLAGIEGRRLSIPDKLLTEQAKEAAKLGLMDAPPKGGVGRGLTTEAIDDIKRGLDALIEKEQSELTGRLTKRGKAINDLKREILSEVDAINPAYKEARKIYAGDAETVQALRDGREFMKLDPEQISRNVADMSASERDAFRSGAARALKDMIDKTADNTDATGRLFGNKLIREKLRPLFETQRAFNEFRQAVERESAFSRTRRTVMGGSPTARIEAEKADMAVDPGVAVTAAQGNYLQAGSQLLRNVMAKVKTPPAQTAQELSGMLFTQDQARNQVLLRELLRRHQMGQAQRNASAVLGGAGLGVLPQYLSSRMAPQ